MSIDLATVFAYHETTKHRFERYARGPGGMDWATQPDQFRRYEGAPLLQLDVVEPEDLPSCAEVFSGGISEASPVNKASISRLVYDSLALSAWKSAQGVTWPLRVNPSSGNLHPTESYILCGAVEGLCRTPIVCHYAPKEHGLEIRAEIPGRTWERLVENLPREAILLGLTSIHWRESWKYGERAYRYCQLDVGHALGAVALAARALGWDARVISSVDSNGLALLFGLAGQSGPEAEEPDCLIAVFPGREKVAPLSVNFDAVEDFATLHWQGTPGTLSPSHRDWPIIDDVAKACREQPVQKRLPLPSGKPACSSSPPVRGSFRRIVHKRRSAQSMDGMTSMPLDGFYGMLERTVPRPGHAPFTLVPCFRFVDLALFVHRVDGLPPGLYVLIRNESHYEELREKLNVEFLWQRPRSCPAGLDLYFLASGDARTVSGQISCFQEIASDGCFSLGMITEFAGPLEESGAWLYPWLFRECGLIGQVLYLEAEAAGLRGTGIGCFFDDAMHELLGLEGTSFQDLYHFTVGGPVEDRRITTRAAYPALTKTELSSNSE